MTMSFNRLTSATRTVRFLAINELSDGRTGVGILAGDMDKIADQLAWKVEDWMSASLRIWWTNYVAKALELACLEAVEFATADGAEGNWWEELDDEWFDRRAAAILEELTASLLRAAFENNFRSDSMGQIEGKIKRDVAKDLLDSLCGLGTNNITGTNAVRDIFAGIARREEERNAKSRQVITSIVYFKKERADGGFYRAHALNNDKTVLDIREWPGVTRKADALTKVAEWVATLRAAGNQRPIEVIAA